MPWFSIKRSASPAIAPKPAGRARNRIIAAVTAAGTVTGVAAMAVNTTGPNEGLRLAAYPDKLARNLPTACYGETRGIKLGMRFTKAECDAMLVKALGEFADKSIERCITAPIGDEPYVAFLDLVYNIGEGAFCKSTVVKRWNAGDRRGACNALLAFNKSDGVKRDGLVARRKREQALCLKGI
ncbi:lysozyme [Methylobacterium sp. WL64]|uniref:lysozyme n=1 Tax=Methylobacterium sp. WL64 TaxID=2603894 RepID=UPI0011C826BF|nr:lysozyme [Methylobacterium sp. WL64]TXN04867.1 lysozyme [Methylobacterium sp. WL64]